MAKFSLSALGKRGGVAWLSVSGRYASAPGITAIKFDKKAKNC